VASIRLARIATGLGNLKKKKEEYKGWPWLRIYSGCNEPSSLFHRIKREKIIKRFDLLLEGFGRAEIGSVQS
jgi:hypothetical protein